MPTEFTGIPPIIHSINTGGKVLSFQKPVVMGILNITPDSFYAGSRTEGIDNTLGIAGKMLEKGASILDIGGYSSRPGAEDISEEKEIGRVIPIIKNIKQKFPQAVVSIDTFRACVAEKAVEAGADIVNDISGGNLDEDMFKVVGELGVPYILMHMKGTPQNMQGFTEYEDTIGEIIKYFEQKILKLRSFGCKDIILDPGFGFAKNLDQNYQLLNQLTALQIFDLPLLVGVSRKSMIYKLLENSPEESLNGTSVLNTIALLSGANILRVHDVKQAAQAIKIIEKLKKTA